MAAAEKQHKFQADKQTRDLVAKIESATKNEEWMRCKLEQQQQQLQHHQKLENSLRSKISFLEEKQEEDQFENRGKTNGSNGGSVGYSGKRAGSTTVSLPKQRRREETTGADMRRVTFETPPPSSSTSTSKRGILKREDGGSESRPPQSTVYTIEDDELPDCYSLSAESGANNEPIDLSPKSSRSQLGRAPANRAWGHSGTIPPLDTTTRRPKAVKTALTFN